MGIESIQNQFQTMFQASNQQATTGATGSFMGHAVSQVVTPETLLEIGRAHV